MPYSFYSTIIDDFPKSKLLSSLYFGTPYHRVDRKIPEKMGITL